MRWATGVSPPPIQRLSAEGIAFGALNSDCSRYLPSDDGFGSLGTSGGSVALPLALS